MVLYQPRVENSSGVISSCANPRPPPGNMSCGPIFRHGAKAPSLGFKAMRCWQASPATAGFMCQASGRRSPARTSAPCAARAIQEIAFRVIEPFTAGEIEPEALRAMIDEAYATFRHPAVVPLVQSGAKRLRARAVPRPDARLQGRGDAADRPADGPLCWPVAASMRRSSAPHPATPAAPRSTPLPGATASTSSSCFPKAGSRRCSSGR